MFDKVQSFDMVMYALCHCMLEICNLLFDLIKDHSYEIALNLRRDFRLRKFQLCRDCERLWRLLSWIKYNLHDDMIIGLWGPRRGGNVMVWMRMTLKGSYLNI